MRILIVEDEPVLLAQLREAVQAAGHVVDTASNGADAHYLGAVERFDAIVLDLGLPVMDGLTVLQRWRSEGHVMPVLILTARDNWYEKVSGMDAGADDYLTKPFHMQELLARLRALTRRLGSYAGAAANEHGSGHASAQWQCGSLRMDTASARVTVNHQPLALTSHEYRVLEALLRQAGQVVSRMALTEHLYAQDFERDSNTIDVFIARLRKKLPPGSIETVRGLGWRLVAAQTAPRA